MRHFITNFGIALFLLFSIQAFATKPSVRVIYLVSKDRNMRQDYKEAIKMAARDIQKWYKKQMNGKTFEFAKSDIVEVLHSDKKASWFTSSPIEGVHKDNWGFDHTLAEVKGILSQEAIPGNYTWVLYSDGPGNTGRGGGNICYLPEDDLKGLIGQHPTQPSIKRWIAGLGHEIGHAFGLPHPVDTDKDADAIMWTGIYGKYPDKCYLTDDDKKILNNSPFFMTDEEHKKYEEDHQIIHSLTYSYTGGYFERKKFKNRDISWIEYVNNGQTTFKFNENNTDETFYYIKRGGNISIKIPKKGGDSYLSTNDWKSHWFFHKMSLKNDKEVKKNEDIVHNGEVHYYNCADLSSINHSGYSHESSEIKFTNNLKGTATLYWVDGESNLHKYGTISPGATMKRSGNHSYFWMIKDDKNQCVGIYRSKENSKNRVNIEYDKMTDPADGTYDESGLKRK